MMERTAITATATGTKTSGSGTSGSGTTTDTPARDARPGGADEGTPGRNQNETFAADDLGESLREIPRFDAASVLAGDELSWLDLVERARATGPDPSFANLDDAALVAELGNRAARIAASTCAYLELVAELAVRGVWADQGARTPGQWLSYQLGIGSSTAADHLRVGLRLRELPAIRERFAAGRISYSKVRAITRIAVPETESLLLQWAQWTTGAEVERLISAFRSTCRTGSGAAGPDRDRSYRSRRNSDGTTTITIRLPDDEAAAVEANLDRLIDLDDPPPSSAEDAPSAVSPRSGPSTDPVDGDGADDEWVLDTSDLDRSPDTDPQAPWSPGCSVFSRERLPDLTGPPLGIDGLLALDAADAGTLVRTDTDTESAGRVPVEDGPVALVPPQRTRSARRADTLVDACAAAVATTGADTSGMDRHTLVVRADVADLQTSAAGHVPVDTPAGRLRAMDPAVLRRLACEANVVFVATDGRLPIDVGRQQRRPTTAQRRALLVRDRSCRFPGCDAHRNLHAHHVVHWADGGPTDLANLVLVCEFHHRFVHDHHWTVTPGAAGTFRFAPPGGTALPPAHQLPGGEWSDELTADAVSDDAHGWALRPTQYHHPNLDLDLAVHVLHQELRALLPHVDTTLDIAS